MEGSYVGAFQVCTNKANREIQDGSITKNMKTI